MIKRYAKKRKQNKMDGEENVTQQEEAESHIKSK